jgi:hypothetical protein
MIRWGGEARKLGVSSRGGAVVAGRDLIMTGFSDSKADRLLRKC